MDIVASYEVEGEEEHDARANLDVLLHGTGVNMAACTVDFRSQIDIAGTPGWLVEVTIPLGTDVMWIGGGEDKEEDDGSEA